MKKILVILGSTSTGKTDLALKLAKKFNGELVSCDSRQVYKKLDIGTGKLPDRKVKIEKGKRFWEMDGIKVWMYDVVNPKKQYTVYRYIKDADRIINEVIKRRNLPILVGGTGLYLKALCEGLPNLEIPLDKKLRKRLQQLSKKQLQEKLQQLAVDKWNNLNDSDKQNPRRLIRAIELITVKPSKKRFTSNLQVKGNILKIGLVAPRENLYDRIDKRIISRVNQGMIKEAEKLHKEGLSFQRMKQLGLEYGVMADYLQGRITSREKLTNILQGKIHAFARRQVTWFKKEKNVHWFNITLEKYSDNVEKKVTKWYYQAANDTKD